MTDDDRIAHLLRRFGLGAGRREVEKYRPHGVEGTLHKLVMYDETPEDFPVSVWEWHTDAKGNVNPDPGSTRAWWIMRMACTSRPLEEKLTMFWHDHFAVSASKVPASEMDDYLVRLRTNATAPFHEALHAVSYSPGMVRWLDSLGSYPARPNENFGREVMELFTLGVGNYTEQDVKETARCFVGLGIQYAIPPGMKAQDYYKEAAERGLPIVSVSVAPGFEDRGTKTIRGKTGPLMAADVLRNLAEDPATARRVIGKLWRYFVSEAPPSDTDMDHLVKIWQKHDLAVRPVLLEMARMHAFWVDTTVGKLPKSPMDFTLALARQCGIGPKFLKQRFPQAGPTASIRALGGPFYYMAQSMSNQGLSLLYPKDVGGWHWGSAWLTSSAMLFRLRLVQQVFRSGWADDYLTELVEEVKDKKTPEAAARILDDLDVQASAAQRDLVAQAIDKRGGVAKAFPNARGARATMSDLGTLMVGIPEFHLA